MLSWAYALYTFDYRWALLGVPFGTRLAFFERHWVRPAPSTPPPACFLSGRAVPRLAVQHFHRPVQHTDQPCNLPANDDVRLCLAAWWPRAVDAGM